jgi:hypothetical protein
MDDPECARILLSGVTRLDIVEVEPLPQEVVLHVTLASGQRHPIYRLDYAARIRDRHGGERIVTIEIQKEKIHSQTMRFRKYLGKQYLDSNFFQLITARRGGSYPVGIPILPIYFLGESPEGFEDVPIILVDRQARDHYTLEPLEGTNGFIDALFHKGILINTPALPRLGRDEAEKVLCVFSKANQTKDPNIMNVENTTIHEAHRLIPRRLETAIQEGELRRAMTAEDEFLAEIRQQEQLFADTFYAMQEALLKKAEAERQTAVAERQKEAAERQKAEAERQKEEERRQKEEALHEKEEVERQKEEAERQKEEAERQKEEERRQKEGALHKQNEAIRLLLQLGVPQAEIAQKLGLSEEDIQRI